MKKRIMGLVLAVAMVMSLVSGFSAGAVTSGHTSDVSMLSVSELAYMDTDSASPALKEAILNARTEIIYGGQAWTVDGAVSIVDFKSGTVTALPEFSDLFPGWDIPNVPINRGCFSASPYSTNNQYYDKFSNEYLNVSDGYTASAIFREFNGDGSEFGALAETSLVGGARYNLGFVDLSSNTELGWVPGIEVGTGAKISTDSYTRYGVRASVNEAKYKGTYRMRVTNDPDVISGFLPA